MFLTTIAVLAQLAICVTSGQAQTNNPLSRQVAKDTSSITTGTIVETLAVKITTHDRRGAGTDNAVYFDVGPWAWRLNNSWRNDFERGRTDTFKLTVPDGFVLSDIIWLRLHKKGLMGVTGTRDGLTGAWHPQRITLLANGVEYASADVTRPLNSRYWFWTKLSGLDPYSDPQSFARSLRLRANDKLGWLAKSTGFFTTPLFKERGISGWLDCPEEKETLGGDNPCLRVPAMVCATGDVFRDPAVSNDGLATIDLTLEVLEFCSPSLVCNQRSDLRQAQSGLRPRYIRVEYPHKKSRVPKKTERVRICGRLRWDTDREGWWEIHPAKASPIEFLTAN